MGINILTSFNTTIVCLIIRVNIVLLCMCNQGANREVRYRIVSVEPQRGSELFFMSAENGRVSVSRPLTEDDSDRYVMTVEAYDLGEPPLSSQATVTVNVIRNKHAPEFSPAQYAKTISRDLAEGQDVEVLFAQDRDTQVE